MSILITGDCGQKMMDSASILLGQGVPANLGVKLTIPHPDPLKPNIIPGLSPILLLLTKSFQMEMGGDDGIGGVDGGGGLNGQNGNQNDQNGQNGDQNGHNGHQYDESKHDYVQDFIALASETYINSLLMGMEDVHHYPFELRPGMNDSHVQTPHYQNNNHDNHNNHPFNQTNHQNPNPNNHPSNLTNNTNHNPNNFNHNNQNPTTPTQPQTLPQQPRPQPHHLDWTKTTNYGFHNVCELDFLEMVGCLKPNWSQQNQIELDHFEQSIAHCRGDRCDFDSRYSKDPHGDGFCY